MPLVSDVKHELPPEPKGAATDRRDPPARRLSILYVSSLAAVAVLIGVSLEIALRELARQGRTIQALAQSAREEAVEGVLCVPALQLLSDPTGPAAAAHAAALRREVARWGGEPRLVTLREAAREESAAVGPEIEAAERSLRATLHAAAAVAEIAATANPSLGPAASAADLTARLRPKVAAVLAGAEALRRDAREAALRVDEAARRRVADLRWLEIQLFGYVMLVLAAEGLFVISPAVRKLQEGLAEMERSHRELSVYAARLERSNRELQDFASIASHDLQEPLRKVQAFSDRLRSKYTAALDDQGRDYIDRVQNAARRMQTLIDDLLTYSRVTTKAQPFVAVDLAAATREVLSDLEVRLEKTGGRVDVAELPVVEADPMQVRQLMQNLIGNALKYHRPEVPPVVRVSGRVARSERVDDAATAPAGGSSPGLAAVAAEEVCELQVEDNGIGFDPAYAERIFGIFQRLHGRSEYEGTGVGLAVCRKIVERHGGSVVARSTPGVGSTFTVTLPLRHPKEDHRRDGPAT